jgi:hypothetical protein
MFRAFADVRRGLPEQIAEEALKTVVSCFFAVGPVVSLAQMALDERRFSRSWIAALMQLRGSAPQ